MHSVDFDSADGTTTGGCVGSIVATGDLYFSEFDTTDVYDDQYKEEEEALWLLIDRREWKEYLKSLWLKVLKLKGYFTSGQCLGCKLYHRRLLISISGWLAREGYAKKN